MQLVRENGQWERYYHLIVHFLDDPSHFVVFRSPDSPQSPPAFTSKITGNNYQSPSSTSSESSSNRSYIRLNKTSVPASSISNQSTPRSTPKSPLSPVTSEPTKRSFFRFNSTPSSTEKSSAHLNPIMGQAGSNVRRSPSDIQTFLDKEREKFLERMENPLRQNARLEDFDLIRTIGTGSFGKHSNIHRTIFHRSFIHRSSSLSHTSRYFQWKSRFENSR